MRKIICPYCFAQFEHDQVHFRSEKANKGICPYIPEDYDDFDDFRLNYIGNDKEEIIRKVADWSFFEEGVDEKYDTFWKHYGGTTTERPSPNRAGYRRKVIDPSLPGHQRHLKKMPNDKYIAEVEGFSTSIQLQSGEICSQRVCPECHNPLPSQYGKNESRFIAVIGVTGAGKTVYLSQLVYDFEDYLCKVGLSPLMTTTSPLDFVRNYPVNTKVPLPGATPPGQFLQPLFYDMAKEDENGNKKEYTLVMYDVAGENCHMESSQVWFGPFIQQMHGICLLIDPMQFKIIKGMAEDESEGKVKPTAVLQTIHHYVSKGSSEKCDVPLAVCISKSDTEILQDVLDPDLVDLLMDDVEEVTNATGETLPLLNGKQYNPIRMGLYQFIKNNEKALENFIRTYYQRYNYFAFTSLGCDVTDEGIPEGPIAPKRIEEPLLWLLYRFGFIGTNEEVSDLNMAKCPCCDRNTQVVKLKGQDRIVVTRKSIFGKVKETAEYDFYCPDCDYYFNAGGETE